MVLVFLTFLCFGSTDLVRKGVKKCRTLFSTESANSYDITVLSFILLNSNNDENREQATYDLFSILNLAPPDYAIPKIFMHVLKACEILRRLIYDFDRENTSQNI